MKQLPPRFLSSSRLKLKTITCQILNNRASTQATCAPTDPTQNDVEVVTTLPLDKGQNIAPNINKLKKEAKSFEEIPGPRAWPIVGTLPHYVFGHGLTRIYDHQVGFL